KGRPSHVKRYRERVFLFGEVIVQLGLCLNEERMKWFFDEVFEAHSSRIIVLPKNRDQAHLACNQFELANRRFHIFIGQAHTQITWSEQRLSIRPSQHKRAMA